MPLEVPQHVGEPAIKDFASVDFEVGSWAPASSPFTDASTRSVTSADLPRVAEVVRREAEKTFGAGFDRPGARSGALAR